MSQVVKTDICIIGAGSAGLSTAYAASQMGASTVLIEKEVRDGILGGDCLHTGCVPSKAMLAAGKHAHLLGAGAKFGVAPQPAEIDFKAVHAHVHGVIGEIAPVDSIERYEGLGVTFIEGEARFIDDSTVEVGDQQVKARRFIIATGSQARVPPIPGLDQVPFHTNETIFDLTERPQHLAILGGGPIALELGQAFRRLGSQVTVLEAAKPLGRDDPEAAAVLLDSLAEDGVTIHSGITLKEVSPAADGGIALTLEGDTAPDALTVSHLLIAIGRKPNFESLNLEAAGVASTPAGITVDARLRTTNKKIYAIGDCTGMPMFTHRSGYHAGIAVRNTVLRLPTKVREDLHPRVTYTDPEIAQIGLTEGEAREAHGAEVQVHSFPFAENDRAIAERDTRGFIKLIGRKNRLIGATIVGAHAGELLYPYALMVGQKQKLTAMTGLIAPYPTLGEAGKRAAGAFYTGFVFGPWIHRLVRIVRHLP